MSMMSLISRQTPSVRCDHYGRRSTPTFKPAAYTDAERARIREREDDMIARMANTVRQQPTLSRDMEAPTVVVGALDKPRTAREIAEILDKTESTVMSILRRLEAENVVAQYGYRPASCGRPRARLWMRGTKSIEAARAAAANRTATISAESREATDKAALAALIRPMQAREVGEAIGMSTGYTFKILRRLFDAGLIDIDEGKGGHPNVYRPKGWQA
jgi:predicted transcriptional regulator